METDQLRTRIEALLAMSELESAVEVFELMRELHPDQFSELFGIVKTRLSDFTRTRVLINFLMASYRFSSEDRTAFLEAVRTRLLDLLPEERVTSILSTLA